MRRPVRTWPLLVAVALLSAVGPGAPAQAPTSLTPEEERSLEEIRDLVKAAAHRYRMVAPPEVFVASWVGSPSLPRFASSSAVYSGGAVHLSRRLLTHPARDLVVAQAVAVEMLRAPTMATSVTERNREIAQRRLDANARAVEILVQVGGLPEEEALDRMYANLIAIRRPAPPAGGSAACDQIADLVRRFPRHRERFAGRECVPG